MFQQIKGTSAHKCHFAINIQNSFHPVLETVLDENTIQWRVFLDTYFLH